MWLPLLAVLILILLYRWHRQSQILEKLSDKFVFITGCDTGFGNLLAKQLDRRGMKVLAACFSEEGASNLKKETSSSTQTIILDVSDSKSVSSAAEWVSRIVGDKGLWGLVNNAAIGGLFAPNGWLQKDDFLHVLNVNLLGLIDVTLTLQPLVRKAQGRIVNVASIVGRVALIPGGYNISKYGVEVFSDTLRRELRDFGVKVCIIEPGGYRTGISRLPLLLKDIKDKWESLPAVTKDCYGEHYLNKTLENMKAMVASGSPKIFKVTDCMEHALTARYPWTRYSAGWDAKLFAIPLSYLPTFISDYVTTRNAPKPARRDL